MEAAQVAKAGRVVPRKPLREQFRFLSADKPRLSVEGSILVFIGVFAKSIDSAKVNE